MWQTCHMARMDSSKQTPAIDKLLLKMSNIFPRKWLQLIETCLFLFEKGRQLTPLKMLYKWKLDVSHLLEIECSRCLL